MSRMCEQPVTNPYAFAKALQARLPAADSVGT